MAKRFFIACAGIFLLVVVSSVVPRVVPPLRAASQVATPTEVAVLSGSITDGGTIPLPHYADGSEALESECNWIVSLRQADSGCYASTLRCWTVGRVVTLDLEGGGCAQLYAAQGNYLIIATRGAGSGPTSTRPTTFGALEARQP